MNLLDVIATRRDGKTHTRAELGFLARSAADESAPDYQLAAWLMAAYLNPLSPEETAWLTLEMAASGERLDLSPLPKPWLDKHSTGGVGDKTTIVLLPLLAACGLTMAKMSGRGLGITGGTVDKLESVPGFRMDLSPPELIALAGRIGVAITGQTPRLAPADKRLYALRDATGTVASIPLIVSSILSKKIAGGSQTIVLDVKCGSGAFMPDLAAARALATSLRDTAKRCGLTCWLTITDMSQPLGQAVGNALEVREALAVLDGSGPQRFRELCIEMGTEALEACGRPNAKAEIEKALDSRLAWKKAADWFAGQGCTIPLEDVAAALPRAPVVREVTWKGGSGWVESVNARIVGEVVVDLGGGRQAKDDRIDPSVGVESLLTVGDRLESGQATFRVHAASEEAAQAASSVLDAAVACSDSKIEPIDLVLERMRT